MRLRFSPTTFTISFCCAYCGAFALNWPLFLYYPLRGNFSWGTHVLKGAGPAMAWYGLMTDAGVAASLLALCVPERLPGRLFRGYLWVFPCGGMLACLFLLRKFFA